MPYLYDIFISYKRGAETNRWIVDHFEPLLAHSVELELGRPPVIFRDDRLKDGSTWPLELGIAIGSSRVLIPLWSKTYFHSEWCVRELSTMLEREYKTKCRTPVKPNGLVIPQVIHDYETVHPNLSHIQYREIRDCFNVRMRHDSARAEQLADELSSAAAGIVSSIENAPSWQSKWINVIPKSFLNSVRSKVSLSQNDVPGFSS